LAQWEVVSSYSSATAPDLHGISCTDPLFQARKELDREVAACVRRRKIYFEFILSTGLQAADRAQQYAVVRERFLLLGQSLKDRIAFLSRNNCLGNVPKIVRGVLLDHML
jgi:hypothetical protein